MLRKYSVRTRLLTAQTSQGPFPHQNHCNNPAHQRRSGVSVRARVPNRRVWGCPITTLIHPLAAALSSSERPVYVDVVDAKDHPPTQREKLGYSFFAV
jgi:hypothetical protein